MSVEFRILSDLSQKIDTMIEMIEFLKKENKILMDSNFLLQQEKQQKDSEIEFYKEEINQLKIANSFKGSKEYKEDTESKIDFLITQIDKCIEDLGSNTLSS